jgi:hypothetical protein
MSRATNLLSFGRTIWTDLRICRYVAFGRPDGPSYEFIVVSRSVVWFKPSYELNFPSRFPSSPPLGGPICCRTVFGHSFLSPTRWADLLSVLSPTRWADLLSYRVRSTRWTELRYVELSFEGFLGSSSQFPSSLCPVRP